MSTEVSASTEPQVGSVAFHIKNVVSLVVITIVVTFCLLYVYYATYVPPNPVADIQKMLGKVSVDYQINSEDFELESGVENSISKTFWTVFDGNTELMRVFKVNAGGFGGPVIAIIGVDGETVKAISILDASGETAGLGQRIIEQKFQRQFIGKLSSEIPTDRTEWTSNGLDMVASASFSSGAVTRNIAQAFLLYRLSLDQSPKLGQLTQAAVGEPIEDEPMLQENTQGGA
ncbi:MAG: FMN-binding protein [Brevinema sp.]